MTEKVKGDNFHEQESGLIMFTVSKQDNRQYFGKCIDGREESSAK